MRKDIYDALLELQDFHMDRGNTNKVAAIESFINSCRVPTWYDYHCVKRAIKEFVAYFEYNARRSTLKESRPSRRLGLVIHSLELVCRCINMYRQSILVGGYLETFDEYFSEEDL